MQMLRKTAVPAVGRGNNAGRRSGAGCKPGVPNKQTVLSLEDHMNQLGRLRDLAVENGQISAAVAAEVKRGELMGFYVQRRENVNATYNISDKPMTEEEWNAEYGFTDDTSVPSTRTH
jgi:hypothetical protein